MTPNKENLKSLILNDKSLLVKCCKHSGDIDDNSIDIVILSSIETEQITQLKIGVFFREALAGCACSDDPSQAIIYENGYCELDAEFNKMTTLISFS